jgi:hypothetical protein
MERFAAGTQKFGRAYEFIAAAEGDPPRRADGCAYHAASSRGIRVSDGPSLWEEGQVVFAPTASQKVQGTSLQVYDFGGRVQVGPGEAGTGFSVSAPG